MLHVKIVKTKKLSSLFSRFQNCPLFNIGQAKLLQPDTSVFVVLLSWMKGRGLEGYWQSLQHPPSMVQDNDPRSVLVPNQEKQSKRGMASSMHLGRNWGPGIEANAQDHIPALKLHLCLKTAKGLSPKWKVTSHLAENVFQFSHFLVFLLSKSPSQISLSSVSQQLNHPRSGPSQRNANLSAILYTSWKEIKEAEENVPPWVVLWCHNSQSWDWQLCKHCPAHWCQTGCPC